MITTGDDKPRGRQPSFEVPADDDLLIITPLKSVYEKLIAGNLQQAGIHYFNPVAPEKPELVLPRKENHTINDNRFRIGLVGISDVEHASEHMLFVINALPDASLRFTFTVFLKKPQFEGFRKVVAQNSHLHQLMETDHTLQLAVYEDLLQLPEAGEMDLYLSYFSSAYLPEEYIALNRFAIPFVAFENTVINNEIFRGNTAFLYAYYGTARLADLLLKLETKTSAYEVFKIEYLLLFNAYLDEAKRCDAGTLLFSDLVDFTESKRLVPKITVVFHFHFYSFDNVTFIYYKQRLREFYRNNVNFLFSITEDSYDIARHVSSLHTAFPGCTVRLVPNKGRDIGAKFLLFDHYFKQASPAEYLVVLHDKKSLHLPYSEAIYWINSLMKIIEPEHYQAIINKFTGDKAVGILGTSRQMVDSILKWEGGTAVKKPVFEWNNDLLHEMIRHYNIRISDFTFIGGTMFWIKHELLEKLNDRYSFLARFTELEEGNVMDNSGSSVTHSWERLLCWLATNLHYKVVGV